MDTQQFTTELGQEIYSALKAKKPSYKRNEMLDPGRTFYVFPFANEDSELIPDVIVKSREEVRSIQRFPLPEHDRNILNQVRDALSRKSKKIESLEKKKAVDISTEDKNTIVFDEDEDIFADAGTDYVLSVSEERQQKSVALFKQEVDKELESANKVVTTVLGNLGNVTQSKPERDEEEDVFESRKKARTELDEKYDEDYDYLDMDAGGLFMAQVAGRDVKDIREFESQRDARRQRWESKNKPANKKSGNKNQAD